LNAFGLLDILVNTAALDPKFDHDALVKELTTGSFEDYPLDQWNAALNVNLTGMFQVPPKKTSSRLGWPLRVLKSLSCLPLLRSIVYRTYKLLFELYS
jgi:hypothetical protein